MLSADEVVEQTGHVIGGVCPFGQTWLSIWMFP